jgi:hypothetical protein
MDSYQIKKDEVSSVFWYVGVSRRVRYLRDSAATCDVIRGNKKRRSNPPSFPYVNQTKTEQEGRRMIPIVIGSTRLLPDCISRVRKNAEDQMLNPHCNDRIYFHAE